MQIAKDRAFRFASAPGSAACDARQERAPRNRDQIAGIGLAGHPSTQAEYCAYPKHMAGHHHHHHDHDHSELSETELRVRALETILTEKGYVDPAALDAIIQAYETKIGPHN